MSKKQHKRQHKRQHKTNYFSWLMKNIFFAGIAILLIYAIFQNTGNKLLLKSLNIDMGIIRQSPLNKTTLQQRYLIALNEISSYMHTLKESSPEDAVILYPEHDAFFPANKNRIFQNDGVANKMWAIRFLYPRKIIKVSELETSPYKEKITHIAFVNRWGHEYISYELEKDLDLFGALPVNVSDEELESIKNMIEEGKKQFTATDN